MADGINSKLAEDSVDGTGESVDTTESTTTDTSETAEEPTTEAAESDTEAVEKLDYSHLMGQGEATTLEEGMFTVGQDIPAGRYRMTVAEGFGNLFVYDTEDCLTFNEVMSSESETISESEPHEAVVFLDEGHKVEILGMGQQHSRPHLKRGMSSLSNAYRS